MALTPSHSILRLNSNTIRCTLKGVLTALLFQHQEANPPPSYFRWLVRNHDRGKIMNKILLGALMAFGVTGCAADEHTVIEKESTTTTGRPTSPSTTTERMEHRESSTSQSEDEPFQPNGSSTSSSSSTTRTTTTNKPKVEEETESRVYIKRETN